jgi:hypothetical protein
MTVLQTDRFLRHCGESTRPAPAVNENDYYLQ